MFVCSLGLFLLFKALFSVVSSVYREGAPLLSLDKKLQYATIALGLGFMPASPSHAMYFEMGV